MRHDLAVHLQEIDDALECRFLADRQLDGHDARAKAHAQLIDDAMEIRVLAIHLVEEEHARQFLLLREVPELLCLDLDARMRRDDDDGGVSRIHGLDGLTDEIGIPRRVEEVQLAVAPFAGRELRLHRQMALLFLRAGIEQARAVIDAAAALRRARVEEGIVEKARLAAVAVPEKDDIPEILALKFFHHDPSNVVFFFRIL